MLVMQRAYDAGSLLAERMAKPEFSSGSALRKIQDSGHIRVGVIVDAPGFSAPNPQTDRLEGLDIAVARKLVQSIFGGSLFMANRNLEFVPLKLAGRVNALVEHEVDLVAAVFIATEERQKQVAFTDPYYGSPLGVVTRADSDIHTMDDVKKATVALIPSTVEFELFAREDLAARAIETSSNNDTINAVLTGEADVGVMAAVIMDKFVADNEDLRRLPVALDNFPFSIGLPQGDRESLDFMNLQIRELVRQGYISLAEAVRKRSF